jgi:hypothetical protein
MPESIFEPAGTPTEHALFVCLENLVNVPSASDVTDSPVALGLE